MPCLQHYKFAGLGTFHTLELDADYFLIWKCFTKYHVHSSIPVAKLGLELGWMSQRPFCNREGIAVHMCMFNMHDHMISMKRSL